MTQIQILIAIEKIAVQAGFWAAFAFPLVTALYWPWWRSWWGWNLVSLDAAIGLALLSGVLQLEFGLKPGSTPGHVLLWVTAVSLCAVPAIIVWRGVLTYLVQRRGEHDQAARDRAPTPPEGIPAAD